VTCKESHGFCNYQPFHWETLWGYDVLKWSNRSKI